MKYENCLKVYSLFKFSFTKIESTFKKLLCTFKSCMKTFIITFHFFDFMQTLIIKISFHITTLWTNRISIHKGLAIYYKKKFQK
jgi:hypothetical protein